MRGRARAAFWALAAVVWHGSESVAHDPVNTKVTWEGEIAPILERRCTSCHSTGGFGQYPLTTYDEARPWAVAIKELTLAGQMPPWGAATGIGHFSNDRRLTRHELELITAWVDGGAPRVLPGSPVPEPAPAAKRANGGGGVNEGGTVVPLAPATVAGAMQRTASVTLQLPAGLVLTRWSVEPGTPSIVERVDFEIASRWLGTWTPGDDAIEFPEDVGVPLPTTALLSARISYRAPAEPGLDRSRLRIWLAREPRLKTVREITVVRSWRALAAVDVLALRPAREDGRADVLARFASGRVEALGSVAPPAHAPHPTYVLARPFALPAGASVETSAPVRLLYATGSTRTVNPNVSRRPRR